MQQARAAGTLNSPPPTVMVPVSVLKHPGNDGTHRTASLGQTVTSTLYCNHLLNQLKASQFMDHPYYEVYTIRGSALQMST